jgi:hypothetical protein
LIGGTIRRTSDIGQGVGWFVPGSINAKLRLTCQSHGKCSIAAMQNSITAIQNSIAETEWGETERGSGAGSV